MNELYCKCGKVAVCTGLYRGKRCKGNGDCETVLTLCEDEIDKPCCADCCSHDYKNEHCHMIKTFTSMTPAEFKAHIMGVIKQHNLQTAKKRAAGICIWIDCKDRALNDRSKLFFGDDHCEKHAREAEIEVLEMEQDDDKRGLDT